MLLTVNVVLPLFVIVSVLVAVAPFVTLVQDNETKKNTFGGGLAGIFNLTDHAGTMIRVEELGGAFYMVSANLQLQLPFNAFNGAARITPFGFVGGAMPFGSHADTSVMAITGAGMDIKFPKLSSHFSMAFDAEYWSDRPGVQWRFSPFVWKF